MKYCAAVALAFALTGSASAFVLSANNGVGRVESSLHMSASSASSRRDILQSLSGAAAVGILGIAANSAPANAAYSQTYLTEPTEEFKANEEKAMAFKREQIKQKAAFNKVLTRLTTESKTEAELVEDLKDLKTLTVMCGGLPTGLKKDDIVKQVRSKKAKGFWPTAVEYEYQALIREIAFQQSPNKDKDDQNPL